MTRRNQKVLISIRGTQYHEADQQFREGRLKEGARLELVRQPENPYDPYAVLIQLVANRSNLGHIGKDYSRKYSELIARGDIVSAVLKSAYKRPTGHLTIQCVIEYRDDDDDSPPNSNVWHLGLEREAGVYEIRNLTNDRCYIGSARDIKARALKHERELRRQSHHNSLLQRDFDLRGINSFSFSIIRSCSVHELHSEEASEIMIRKSRGQDLYNATNDGQGLVPISAQSPSAVTPSNIPPRQLKINESSSPSTSESTSGTALVCAVIAVIILLVVLSD